MRSIYQCEKCGKPGVSAEMDTIKADIGYEVCGLKRNGALYAVASWHFTDEECTHLRVLLDGDTVIMVACLIPFDEYQKEREQNEMFHLCERFTTRRGNHYIYWRDEETDTDYITKEV